MSITAEPPTPEAIIAEQTLVETQILGLIIPALTTVDRPISEVITQESAMREREMLELTTFLVGGHGSIKFLIVPRILDMEIIIIDITTVFFIALEIMVIS